MWHFWPIAQYNVRLKILYHIFITSLPRKGAEICCQTPIAINSYHTTLWPTNGCIL